MISSNLTNIWAGVGAQMWAVAKPQSEFTKGIPTKAQKMLPGSPGLLYCTETKSFTTPFIVYSTPREGASIRHVWPEEWTLPFAIIPLGSPRRQLTAERAKEVLPVLADTEKPWYQILHFQATTAFVPTEIGEDDWQIIIQHLADCESKIDGNE